MSQIPSGANATESSISFSFIHDESLEMNIQTRKTTEHNSQHIANNILRKQIGRGLLEVEDNPPETVMQRRLLDMADKEMVDTSPQVRQTAQLVQAFDAYQYPRQQGPAQRARGGKKSKHNRKNIRLAKAMGFHPSEFFASITPAMVEAENEFRTREPESDKISDGQPDEDAIDVGKIRRQEQSTNRTQRKIADRWREPRAARIVKHLTRGRKTTTVLMKAIAQETSSSLTTIRWRVADLLRSRN